MTGEPEGVAIEELASLFSALQSVRTSPWLDQMPRVSGPDPNKTIGLSLLTL